MFPHVHLYLQNHVEGIAFQPAPANGQRLPELRQADGAPDPRDAHFFLAACSTSPQPAPSPLVYVPTTANVLHERELHIAKLEIDVNQLREEKQKLVEMFRIQEAALEEANRWSSGLDEKLAAASARIVQLQNELQQTTAGFEAQIATLQAEDRAKTEWAQQLDQQLAAASARIVELETAQVGLEAENHAKTEWVASLSAALEQSTLRATPVAEQLRGALSRVCDLEAQLSHTATSERSRLNDLRDEVCAKTSSAQQLVADLERTRRRLRELEAENDAKTGWARRLEADLDAKGKDLAHCVEVLHATEKSLEERTARMLQMEESVNRARSSRWVRLGNLLGLGPRLNGE